MNHKRNLIYKAGVFHVGCFTSPCIYYIRPYTAKNINCECQLLKKSAVTLSHSGLFGDCTSMSVCILRLESHNICSTTVFAFHTFLRPNIYVLNRERLKNCYR